MKQRRIVFVLVVMISMIMSLPGMGRAQKLKGSRAGARGVPGIQGVESPVNLNNVLQLDEDPVFVGHFQSLDKFGKLDFSIVDVEQSGLGDTITVTTSTLGVEGLQENERLIGAGDVECLSGFLRDDKLIGISNFGRIFELEVDSSGKFVTASQVDNLQLPITEGSDRASITTFDRKACEIQVIDSDGKQFLVNLDGTVSRVNDLNADAAARFQDEDEEDDFIRPSNPINSVNVDKDLTYYIDSKTDALFSSKIAVLGNAGLTKIGDLGMDITSSAGMDFDSEGNLLAALTKEGESHSNLYQIDLETGQPTLIVELDSVLESLSVVEGFSVSVIDPPSAKMPFSSTEQQTLTATLIGAEGEPLADTAVNIIVEGVNNFSVQDVTDGEGNVMLTYKNDSGQAGTDTITVSAEGVADFIAFPATVVWSDGPFINNIKVKGEGNKIKIAGLQFRPDDQVFINGQQIPANLVKFKGEGNIVLKLKNRKGEFLNPCVDGGSSNTITMVSSEGEAEEATFVACP